MEDQQVSTIDLQWFKDYTINKKKTKTYIPTNYMLLDSYIDGLYGGCLYLIGARPGIGKTTFVLNLLSKQKGKKCLVFTTETSKEKFLEKFLSLVLHLEYKNLRQNLIETTTLFNDLECLKAYNIYLVDCYKPTVKQIEDKVKEILPDILIIDYFQNVRIQSQMYKYQEYTNNVENIFNISRNYNIPVILCSQLKRFSENRKDDEPELSDFKETGKLEETAHAVMLLHQTDGRLVCSLAKNRDGQIGELKFKGLWQYNKLEETL